MAVVFGRQARVSFLRACCHAAVRRPRLQARDDQSDLPRGAGERRRGQLPFPRQDGTLSGSPRVGVRRPARHDGARHSSGPGEIAEEKLRAYIRLHSEAILATTGPSALQQLLHREIQEPTVGLDSLVDRTLKPRFEYLFKVIGELLDLPPHDERVTLSALSIHGLILMFRPNPMADRFGARLKLKFTPERITEHLLTFSLAALDAYRRGRWAQGSRLRAEAKPSTK